MATKTSKSATKAAKLLRNALKLPAADRADIGSCLLGSVHGTAAAELHPDWDKEIKRRVEEIKEGKVKLIPRQEAEKRMFGDA